MMFGIFPAATPGTSIVDKDSRNELIDLDTEGRGHRCPYTYIFMCIFYVSFTLLLQLKIMNHEKLISRFWFSIFDIISLLSEVSVVTLGSIMVEFGLLL